MSTDGYEFEALRIYDTLQRDVRNPDYERLCQDLIFDEGGVCLKVERERKGNTQAELSAMTGIPQPHISQMERGRRPIGKKSAHQLAEALRVFL